MDQTAEYRAALEQFRKNYLVAAMVQKRIEPKLTESAAKSYYSKNRSRFRSDQVHLMHILAETEADARAYEKRVRAGADFQVVAEKYSKDPMAHQNRGDMGYVFKYSWPREFSDVVFAAKDGEIVGPIHTAYGYHVVKVLDHRPGPALNYDEVELPVKAELRDLLARQYIQQLRSKSKIDINEAALAKK